MGRADENKIIYKTILVSTYKKFLNNPLKTFVVKDFNCIHRSNKFRTNYLNTLIRLDLIKEVPAVYQCGKSYRVRREVKGYRLLIKNISTLQ